MLPSIRAGKVSAVTPVKSLLALIAAAVANALEMRALDTVWVLESVSSLAAAARIGTPLMIRSPVPNVGNAGAVFNTVGLLAAVLVTTMSWLEEIERELEKITLEPDDATEEKSDDKGSKPKKP